MKKFLLAAIGCFLYTATYAQSAQQGATGTVKGLVIDSVANKPLGYVTVALTDPTTSLPVKSNLTKDDGTFELARVDAKSYKLSLVFMGYTTKTITITGTAGVVDIGRVLLSPSNKQLKEVSVVGAKPLMKQEVDRISYDVLADPESKSLTALDMIRKVPLLSVDASDNIKLRGSGNYKILINGKESALMAQNPADILKSMPGTNIVKIEVITTPPAKYDAEGLAGIINIITQKKADQGYNGSVNANYNTVWGERLNLNATVKQGKFGFNGYIGTGKRPKRESEFGNESTFFTSGTSVVQKGNRFMGGNNTYGSTELSYEADSLNLITGTFNFYNGTNNNGNNQNTVQRNNSDDITQAYNIANNGNGEYHGRDVALNYQLGFKKSKEQLLTASFKYSNNYNKQFNDVLATETFNYAEPNYRQYNSAGSKEYTTQLDYVHPLKLITIEAGGKMIARNSYSDFHTDTLASTNQYITDGRQVNDFNYHQDVYSAYNSYQLKLTKWTVKGGVRVERTNINADFSSTGSSLDQNFTNVVPSLSLQRSLKNSSLTFGFTQRIQRPGIYQLNPFVNQSNPKFITVGNPELRPAVNNNFELSYGNFTKGSINISTNYSFANNTIQNLATVDQNSVTTNTYANVGKNKNLGLDVNINYPITTKMNINLNAELMQVWLNGTFNGEFYTNSGQQGHVFTNGSYKWDNGYRVGFNIGFDSRYVLLQGKDNYWLGGGFMGAKEILNKKATISVNVNNPFKKFNKLDFLTKTADFESTSYNYNFYRSINISFNYKFGKLNGSIKKNQRGINNDDTSSGESRN
jgi:outer membrane receptor protein involved in Fe transport